MQLLRLSRYPESAKSVIRERMEEFTAYDLLNKFATRHWKDEASLGEALKSHSGMARGAESPCAHRRSPQICGPGSEQEERIQESGRAAREESAK